MKLAGQKRGKPVLQSQSEPPDLPLTSFFPETNTILSYFNRYLQTFLVLAAEQSPNLHVGSIEMMVPGALF